MRLIIKRHPFEGFSHQVHHVGDGFQASPSMAPGLLAFLDCGGKLDVSWQNSGKGWWGKLLEGAEVKIGKICRNQRHSRKVRFFRKGP